MIEPFSPSALHLKRFNVPPCVDLLAVSRRLILNSRPVVPFVLTCPSLFYGYSMLSRIEPQLPASPLLKWLTNRSYTERKKYYGHFFNNISNHDHRIHSHPWTRTSFHRCTCIGYWGKSQFGHPRLSNTRRRTTSCRRSSQHLWAKTIGNPKSNAKPQVRSGLREDADRLPILPFGWWRGRLGPFDRKRVFVGFQWQQQKQPVSPFLPAVTWMVVASSYWHLLLWYSLWYLLWYYANDNNCSLCEECLVIVATQ